MTLRRKARWHHRCPNHNGRLCGTRLAAKVQEESLHLPQVMVQVFDPEKIVTLIHWVPQQQFERLIRLLEQLYSAGRESACDSQSGCTGTLAGWNSGTHWWAGSVDWVVPFSVVEDTPTGKRRRCIAWPYEKNDEDGYEAQLMLNHISAYLPVVTAATTSCLDFCSSSLQSSLIKISWWTKRWTLSVLTSWLLLIYLVYYWSIFFWFEIILLPFKQNVACVECI